MPNSWKRNFISQGTKWGISMIRLKCLMPELRIRIPAGGPICVFQKDQEYNFLEADAKVLNDGIHFGPISQATVKAGKMGKLEKAK